MSASQVCVCQNYPTPMLYSIPNQETQLYSFVDFVQIRFKVLFAA